MIGTTTVPHPGCHDVLAAKVEVIATVDRDWVVHHDSDEMATPIGPSTAAERTERRTLTRECAATGHFWEWDP